MDTKTHIISGLGPSVKILLPEDETGEVVVVTDDKTKTVNLGQRNEINFAA